MPHVPDFVGRALDGRYELHAVIGEGTFGRVYRGRDRRLARPVAVKVIKPWWAEDPDWVLSFEREAQLLARVSDPGIVQIFDVGHAEEGLYYVAELVDGESLAQRLRRGPLSALDACQLTEQLCRALAQAHAKRVVHRDIKPANVLISAGGRVKVGDFGVARLAEGSTDGDTASVVGTPRYMAPEQARGLPTTPATDVYGVGIVLYEMLAGRPPFVERSAVELALRHLQEPPPPLPEHVPPVLSAVVDRALGKAPADRFQSGGAMADALAQARASFSPAEPAALTSETAAVSSRAAGPTTARPQIRPSASSTTTHPPEAEAGRRSPRPSAVGTAREVEATRLAPRWTPRRNVSIVDRRQSRALFALVLAVLLGLVSAAVILALGGHLRVPELRGLRRAAITARTRGLSLRLAFGFRHGSAPAGVAVAQTPRAGTRVSDGATVSVVLSAGPPPVEVPSLLGQPSTAAEAALGRIGLSAGLTSVPAPGRAAGTVVGQTPMAGAFASRRSTVALAVAETPRWRTLTGFAVAGGGQSVPFRIRGRRWRVVYSMHYRGTCTLIFICSGPTAHVARLSPTVFSTQFDLGEGDGQTRSFEAGPGIYQVGVTPGSDVARSSIQVQDFY